MRNTITAAIAVASALWLSGVAGAGGWATVGVSPEPPDGAAAGTVWTPTLRVLQHGRTPLDGVQPTILVSDGSGPPSTFAARPTGKPGTYSARVVFPSAGRWTYRVDDGFGREHGFPALTIRSGEGSAFPLMPLSLGVGAAFAAILGWALLLRRRRPHPKLAVDGMR